MDGDLKKLIYVFLGIFCCGLIIFCIIAIFVSKENLSATEVGLDYDTARIKIDASQLYTGGLHFIGVTHKFIKFETNLQQMQ